MGMRNRKKTTKKKGGLVVLIVLVLLVAVGFFGASKLLNGLGNPYNPNYTEGLAVTVASGMGTEAIGNLLKDAGIIGSVTEFKLYSKMNGYDGKMQAGDYVLSPSQNMEEIMTALMSGRSETKRFTIPEGYSVAQAATKLADDGMVNYDEFMAEAENGQFEYSFMSELPAGKERLEGFLFPETYEVYMNATAHDIIDRMLGQFNKVFTEEYYAKAKEMGYSMRDIITIASIVEREARTAEDRPLVASVIYNRLNINMKLEMCSTVQYILGEPKANLTYDDIAIEDPYNTYISKGLPPGPICSPGAESIKAALYPADTDYLYFVVSEKMDGSHAFSSSYEQFLKDKDAYKKAQ